MNDYPQSDGFFQQKREASRLKAEGLSDEQAVFFAGYEARMQRVIESTYKAVPGLPKIVGGIIDSSKFNACACFHDGAFFIALNSGVPLVLHTVLCRILAERQLLIEIGEHGLESDQHPPLPSTIEELSHEASLDQFIVPCDPFRRDYAIYICELIFEFLVCHELAHIINGHVGYIKEEKGLDFVSDIFWQPGTPRGNLELQAMELDADSTATRQLVHSMCTRASNTTKIHTRVRTRYSQPEQYVFDLAFSISVCFRLFEDERIVLAEQANSTHPPRRWRQMQILNMMGNYFCQYLGDSSTSRIETCLTKAIELAEDAIEKVTNTSQQVLGLHDAWHGDGWPYTRIVQEHWNQVVLPKVRQYAFASVKELSFDIPE